MNIGGLSMKTQLTLLAIRFILRRLLSRNALDRVDYYIEEANKLFNNPDEKYDFVKEKVLAGIDKGEDETDSKINAAIELAVLAKKLVSTKVK